MKRKNWKIIGLSFLLLFSQFLVGLYFLGKKDAGGTAEFVANEGLQKSGITITHPPDLELVSDDPTTHVISWTLTEDEAFNDALDYLGVYSFTEDAVGSDPNGWTTIEPSHTSISVVSDYTTHAKVLFLDDDSTSGCCDLHNYFTGQSFGAIEFWFLMPDVSCPFIFQCSDDPKTNYAFTLTVSYDVGGITEDFLGYWHPDGSWRDLVQLSDDTWYHLRVTFECGGGGYDSLSAYTYNIYLNGMQYGPYNFYSNIPTIEWLRFNTYDFPRQPSEAYVDAIDYSWAPGYYPNRNMDHQNGSSPKYAIFENGVQKTNWQQWSNQLHVHHTVSGLVLGGGVHNISLVYNDRQGQWHHDDVVITVNEVLNSSTVTVTHPPDVELVADDPTTETISWTLTADEVSHEPRDYLGAYSFTDDAVGTNPPTGWPYLYHYSGSEIEVISEKDGHSKVIEFTDSGAGSMVRIGKVFSAQTTGTFEWWFYTEPNSDHCRVRVSKVPAVTNKIILDFDAAAGEYSWYNSSSGSLEKIDDLTANLWHHIRLTFNCTSDTFLLWVNGICKGEYEFMEPGTTLDRIDFETAWGGTSCHFYVDAIDYSWAPGYYPNRNMDYEPSPKDYLGAYSFTEDADGSNPAGWNIISEPSNTHIDVVAEKDGHRKVLECWDNNTDSSARVYTTFSSQTRGVIEYWVRHTKTIGYWTIMQAKDSAGWDVFRLDIMENGELRYNYGTPNPICNLSENTWHHLRVTFEHTTGGYDGLSQFHFNIYINGMKYGEFPFHQSRTHTQQFHIVTGTVGDSYLWIDAVDYSWAPGYYTNRNMNYSNRNMGQIFAVFINNTQKTSWQQWDGPTQVDYNVSGASLGVGVHNVSLVFNDKQGQWHHDDVVVNVSTPEMPKLISFWKFDEASDLMAYDAQGLNNATLHNMDDADWVTGKSGYALDFDGSNDYVKINKSASLDVIDGSTELSIAFWIYMEDMGSREDLILRYDSGGGTNLQFYLIHGLSANKLRWVVYTEYSSYHRADLVDTHTLNIKNNWVHFVCTYDDGTIKIYKNGVEMNVSVEHYGSSNVIRSDAGHITVGINPNEASYPFDGKMDEVRIYKKTLTSGEISNLYTAYIADYGLNETSPILNPISPNPDEDGRITLNWSDVANASQYYVYRGVNPITSVDAIAPIGSTSTNSYQDIIHVDGFYYYVIVAGNTFGNSSISNCESVEVLIPSNGGVSVTHPPDVELVANDPTTQTISWTLTADEVSHEPRDYLGACSFTEDAVGSDPANLSVFEGPTCAITVISEKESHKNVLEGYDGGTVSGQYWQLEDTFSHQATGTMEYYIQTSDSSKYFRMYLYEGVNFAIYMYLDGGNLNCYYDGAHHVICPISNDIFYHFKIDWNGSGWQVKVDDTQYGSGYSYGFRIAPISGINRTHFSTASADGDYYHYLDAIDYSWAPGYYPNRNMDYGTGPKDYLGHCSFTEDANGSNPAGWIIMSEPSNTHIDVVAEKDGHQKVLEVWDNRSDGYARVYTTFSSQTHGAIEYWVRYTKSIGLCDIMLTKDSSGWDCFLLLLGGDGELWYNYGIRNPISSICNLSEKTWHHIRVTFEHTTGGYDGLSRLHFNIYVNGLKYGEFPFHQSRTHTQRFHICTYPVGYSHLWIDAVDYSWAPGYYPNRNMDYLPSDLTHAIFENGTRKTNWQQWSGQDQVNYNVSGLVLGGGVHNISLVFNDTQGQWHHDDVVVNVSGSEMPNIPNIVGVTHDPTNPTYQDIVNVTAHVIDRMGIQGVYLETNHTSMTIRDYAGVDSFADEPVGADPAGWKIDEPDGTTIDVISEKDGHVKVVEIFKNTSPYYEHPGIFNIFSPKAASAGYEIEFWMHGDSNATGMFDVGNGLFGFYSKIFLIMEFYRNELRQVINGGSSTRVLSSQLWSNQWHHFRIKILGNRAFQIWLNNDYLGQFDGVYSHASFDRVVLGTWHCAGPFSVWVDAVDYSWAPGYYTNRNMDPAGLRNYSMTLSSGTPHDGIWKCSIPEYPLNEFISYRVIAQNTLGNMNGTNQYNFGVFDNLAPEISTITQIPAVPTGEEPLTISAHIIDTNPVQEVLIETNHSSERNYLGEYSYTNNEASALSNNWAVAGSINTGCSVIASKNGHKKVLEFNDNNNAGSIGIENTFICKWVGTIEFWIFPQTSPLYFRFKRSNHMIGTELRYYPGTNEFSYFNGVNHKLCDMPSNTWHHVRVQFDCFKENSSVWVNGTLVGTDLTFWDSLCNSVSRFFIGTDGSATGVSYVDAIDYSWAPGYYLNRNMKYDRFNNYSMTLSSGTLKDGIYNFTVNNPSLNNPFAFRIHALDVFGNINSTEQLNFEVFDTPLNSPILAPILPNPDEDGIITLNWSAVEGASTYYIYRNTLNITSVAGLAPIANTSATYYQDIIALDGTYYYVIVAGNSLVNSSISNYVSVTFGFFLPPNLQLGWNITEVISTESVNDSNVAAIEVDGMGNVHIVWSDYTNYNGCGTDIDIFYKRWDATTKGWTSTEVVSTESTGLSYRPDMVIDAFGNLHLVWNDYTNYGGSGTDTDIFYKLWNATTMTWTVTEVISTESTSTSNCPDIAIDASGNLHVIWHDSTNYNGAGTDYDIFYKYWNATTKVWALTEVVSTESTSSSYWPAIEVDGGGNVHAVWYDFTNYGGSGSDRDIFYKRKDVTTGSWRATEVVSTESTGHSFNPALIVDWYENVHVIWYDYTNYGASGTDGDIFYKRWNATAGSWTEAEIVSTESTRLSFFPDLALDGFGNIHIIWADSTNYNGSGPDYDIFYKRWNIITRLWTSTEVISTESTSTSNWPDIVVDSFGNLHLVWHDVTNYNGAGTDYDIFYKQSYPLWFLDPPFLEPILPNPDSYGIINLNWTDEVGATTYYIYRDTSNITSIQGMQPLTNTPLSYFQDILFFNGTYYYVVIAGNATGNSTISNCESVTVAIPPPEPATLDPILPNPNLNGIIDLNWDDVANATHYYVYKDFSPISSVTGLTPIATVNSSNYTDIISLNGIYHYVIITGRLSGNSSISNCENITVLIPLNPPVLQPISPNPVFDGNIYLNWSYILGATSYYIYRNTSLILTTTGLTPITEVTNTVFQDLMLYYGMLYYVIVASDFSTNTSISNCESVEVAMPSIEHTIEWSVPRDLDFEINLAESKDCTIAFNFENTGNTTFLNLNFTIDLPLGWSAEINSVSIHRLGPQESASLLFRITVPDSVDDFLEVIFIDFEATVLETGENYTDSIPIVVAGKTTGNFIIWLIVIVGSVAGVASFNFVVIRRRRREERIQTLFTKVLDIDYRPTIQVPIVLEETHFQSQNHDEVTPNAVGESETIIGSTLELNVSEQPYFSFTRLCRAFYLLLDAFPLLGALYPGEARFRRVMELKDLPDEELHLFFSDHVEVIPHSEVLFQLTLMLNELKDAEENQYQILLFNKIEKLIDTAIAFKDRKLLNDLLQLIILIKCS